MPADPKHVNEAVTRQDTMGWKATIVEKYTSINDHDVVEWMVPPEDVHVFPIEYSFQAEMRQRPPRKLTEGPSGRSSGVFMRLTRAEISSSVNSSYSE